MWGWMTWREAGHVDRLGREVVVTEFFHVIIPVWARERSRYYFRQADGEEVYVEIPRDVRSLALGYLRTPIWFTATILAAGGVMKERWGLLAIAVGLAVVGAVLTFVAGTLDPLERDRRSLFQRVAGIGVPPELISRAMRERTRDQLAEQWFDHHEIEWRTSIALGVADEVLIVIAEYDRAPKLADRARQNLFDAEGN